MDFSLYVLPVWSILSLATLVRSIFGFGEALVAMPLLVNIVDFKTATPLIAMVACTISVAIIIFDLQNIQLNSAWHLAVSSFVGIPLGLPLLKAVDVPLMKVILSLVIIGFSAYRLRKPQLLTLDNEKFSFAFWFSGRFSGRRVQCCRAAGCHLWCDAQVVTEDVQGNTSGLFPAHLDFYRIRSWSYRFLDPFGVEAIFFSLPLLFLAYVIGSRINRSIPQESLEKYIHCLLIGVGTFLLVRTVYGILASLIVTAQ